VIATYDHWAWLTQPTHSNLQHTAQQIASWIFDADAYHAPVEFRKYLFRYINGLPNNKELKKKIPQAREYSSLKILLDDYFTSLWIITT
jgi:hypothetical protein